MTTETCKHSVYQQHYVLSKEYIHVFCTVRLSERRVITNLGQPYGLVFVIKLQCVFWRYTMIFNLLFRLLSAFKVRTLSSSLLYLSSQYFFTVIHKGKVVPAHVMKTWTKDLQLHSF